MLCGSLDEKNAPFGRSLAGRGRFGRDLGHGIRVGVVDDALELFGFLAGFALLPIFFAAAGGLHLFERGDGAVVVARDARVVAEVVFEVLLRFALKNYCTACVVDGGVRALVRAEFGLTGAEVAVEHGYFEAACADGAPVARGDLVDEH